MMLGEMLGRVLMRSIGGQFPIRHVETLLGKLRP